MKKFTFLLVLLAFVAFNVFGQTVSTDPVWDTGTTPPTVNVCEGGDVTVNVHNPTPSTQHTLSIPGSPPTIIEHITSDASGNDFSFSPLPFPSQGTYNYNVFAADWSLNVNFNVVVASDPTAPVLNMVPASPVCESTSVKATINTAGSGGVSCSDRYEYSTDGGNTWLAYTLNTDIPTTGKSTIKVKSIRDKGAGVERGCYAETEYSWTVNPAPTPTITPTSGDYTVCIGETDTYTTETGKNSYVWTITGTHTVTGGLTNDNVIVQWTGGTTGTVSVTYANPTTGCTPLTDPLETVTIQALPVPTITPSTATSYCAGATETFSTETGMDSYVWTINYGTITAGQGTASIDVTWDMVTSVQAGQVTVTYDTPAPAGCSPAAPTAYNPTINPLPIVTISGETNPCANSTHIYTTQPGMSNYLWSVPVNDGSITGGGGSGDNTATVTWNNTLGIGSVFVNYTNTNGCTATSPTQYDVTKSGLVQNTTTGIYYCTIQDAINDANANNVIEVSVGTYNEDLVFNVSGIELMPKSGDAVTIKGVDTEPVANWPLANPNIEILASGVKIHGFTIQSPAYVSGYYSSGIVIGAANVAIYENDFEVWAGNDVDGDEISQAIQTYFKGAMPGVDISGLNIHDNTFAPLNTGTQWGYEGIYVNLDEGTGTITIADNDFSGELIRAITVERSKATISGNTIITDLPPYASPGALEGISIRNMSAGGPFSQSTITISGNEVKGSAAGKGFLRGIRIGINGQTLTGITVTGNTLSGNTIGALVRSSANGVLINTNKITGNTTGVINEDASYTLNAENNWWGDATGPYHNPNNTCGLGDPVSDNVDFMPWWMTATGPGTWVNLPVQNTTTGSYYCKIQDAIDDANANNVIEVSAGTYNENVILPQGKSLTLLGAQANVDPRGGRTGSESILDGGGYSSGNYGIELQETTGNDVVTINGFTIRNYDFGIWGHFGTSFVQNLTVSYNIFEDNGDPALPDAGGWNHSGGAIRIDNVNYSTFSYNEIMDCERGIRLDDNAIDGSDNNTIEYNLIHDLQQYGIGLYDYANDNTVKYNEIYNCADRGIQLFGANTGNKFLNNEIYNICNDGILLYNSTNVEIKNNEIYNCAFTDETWSGNNANNGGPTSGFGYQPVHGGIALMGTCSTIEIKNNDLHNNGVMGTGWAAWNGQTNHATSDGIWLDNTSTAIINNNKIISSNEYGVENTNTTTIDA
ncbi:MAG: right-handed parallel beta-helix repeat-containing protein, partial [Bacteroidales bacterium]|nr:right-handed parallel beta-helix repeat-containing protein [Bacteroidales bacterium]